MLNLRFRYLALLPLTVSAAHVAAREPAAASAAPGTVSPDNEANTGLGLSGFQLHADVEGEKTAKLTLSRASDLASQFGEFTAGITFSAPIDKGTKQGALVTRRGLTSGFGAEVSLGVIMGSAEPPESLDGDPSVPVATPMSITLIQATGSIGVDDFKFRDPLAFTEDKRRRTTYAVGASIGHAPKGTAIFVSGGFEYRRGWEAPDKRIICPAPTGTANIECTQAVFGPPERDVDKTAFASVRMLNPLGLGSQKRPIGFELRAAYDAKDDVFGVEAPLYFLRDAKGALRGGLKIGWDTKDKDLGVSFFVGIPFGGVSLSGD